MDLHKIIVGVSATWFVAASLVYWDGPCDVFAKLREAVGTNYTDDDGKSITFLGRQFQCFWCAAAWVSFPAALILLIDWQILLPPALAGGALLLSHQGRMVWRKMADG
jgi:hypothetical protein